MESVSPCWSQEKRRYAIITSILSNFASSSLPRHDKPGLLAAAARYAAEWN